MRVQSKYKKISRKGRKILFSFLLIILFFLIFGSTLKTFFLWTNPWAEKIEILFTNKGSIFEENKRLREQLDYYNSSKEIIYRLKEENRDLKERLAYEDLLNDKRKLFNVLSYEKDGLYKSLVLDDPDNFLEKNDLIFSKYNVLIGKVFDSKDLNLVKVKLFSSLGEKNEFIIYDGPEAKLKLKAEGLGSGLFKVIAPRNLKFKNPQKTFLVYPGNSSYLVAKLVDNQFKTQDSNRILYFKMLANPELLSRVESEILTAE